MLMHFTPKPSAATTKYAMPTDAMDSRFPPLLLRRDASPPSFGTESEGIHAAASDVQLNDFLGDPLWWPQEDDPPSCEGTAIPTTGTCTMPTGDKAGGNRCQKIRLLLAEAHFETVDLGGWRRIFSDEIKDVPEQLASSAAWKAKPKMTKFVLERIPPCFALFTRFNCNVTLVAQKLFASKLAVSVLTSGIVTVKGEDIIRMLKYTKGGERVYKRHVMLLVNSNQSDSVLCVQKPFSYGFLLAFLHALPPKACELVLSKSRPFGAILDECGVSRSVEVERQLHIHIRESFFSPTDVNPQVIGYDGIKASANEGHQHEQNNEAYAHPGNRECQCKILPKGMRCTFGRLTAVHCNGKPVARVLEILNEQMVLPALFEIEEKRQLESDKSKLPEFQSSGGKFNLFQQRTAFLAGRCLHSVALCPQHRAVLPKPHMMARELRAPRKADAGCHLCGSKTCSTDFHVAYLDDLP